jgi:hypothetical protein
MKLLSPEKLARLQVTQLYDTVYQYFVCRETQNHWTTICYLSSLLCPPKSSVAEP